MSWSLAGSPSTCAASTGTSIAIALPLGFDRRRQVRNHAAEDLTHVAARHLQRLLTRIETRQSQQVLDQPLHARACAAR